MTEETEPEESTEDPAKTPTTEPDIPEAPDEAVLPKEDA